MTKPIITVLGSTGQQGGAVVRSLLREGKFAVRAVTRSPDSDKANALRAEGVEIVAANLDDTTSLEKAFNGSTGVFVVSNFWESMDVEKEKQQLTNAADAAAAAGVEHVVLSTLESASDRIGQRASEFPTLAGGYKVPHFDGKAEVTPYFQSKVPTTVLITSFFMENFIYFGMGPKRHGGADSDASISIPMGETPLLMNSTSDIGNVVAKLFEDASWIGKTVGMCTDAKTTQELAQTFSKVLGYRVVVNEVTPEQFGHFGFPGAEDLGNMFQYFRDFSTLPDEPRSLEATKKVHPNVTDFETWLTQNKDNDVFTSV